MAKFNSFIKTELFNMVVGKQIGEGSSRKVYEHRFDPSLVIKIESAGRSFANIKEYEVWDQVRWSKTAKWFAPVVDISACGSVLFMKKVNRVRSNELPSKVPSFFTDLKPENWGWLESEGSRYLVCCDYGITLINITNNTKKAEWVGE